MPRMLIFGRTGQLARELARRGAPDWTFLGRDQVDFHQPETAAEAVRAFRPELVLIAAAYTAVDRAEEEEASARRINAESPSRIADACAEAGAAVVHVSTDYVFDGAKPDAYVETDPTGPTSAYGRTKLDGERGVLNSGARAAVIRTSWVYSAWGSNFPKTMLRLAGERKEVRVVADQVGTPTAAGHLAEAVIALGVRLVEGQEEASGLTHYAGEGGASWADFAQAVMDGAASRGAPAVPVVRISTSEFPTKAKRPANSRLDCSRAVALGIPPRPWRAALDGVLDELVPARG